MTKLVLNRNVTIDECHWLDRDYAEGEEVFAFSGFTYGVISHTGIAVTKVEGEGPFFELPRNAVGFEKE